MVKASSFLPFLFGLGAGTAGVALIGKKCDTLAIFKIVSADFQLDEGGNKVLVTTIKNEGGSFGFPLLVASRTNDLIDGCVPFGPKFTREGTLEVISHFTMLLGPGKRVTYGMATSDTTCTQKVQNTFYYGNLNPSTGESITVQVINMGKFPNYPLSCEDLGLLEECRFPIIDDQVAITSI